MCDFYTRAILVLAMLFVVPACTSHNSHSPYIKASLVDEDYEGALKRIERINKSTSQLLYLYEKALVLHYEDRYEESNAAFEEADLLYEDLYTKSISRAIGSLFSSDNVVKYRGERYEVALIHYYKIFNYFYLKQPESALVECRRLNNLLQQFADSGERVYPDDPFLQYFTGLVYQAYGEYDDANVSFRVAQDAYETLGEWYEVDLPEYFYCDLALSAEQVYDDEAATEYREKAACDDYKPTDGTGTLNLFIESGYIPHKIEEDIVIPLYRDEFSSDVNRNDYTKVLAHRYGQPRDYRRKLQYLMKVAMPTMVSTPFPFDDIEVRVIADSLYYRADTRLVENLDKLAFQAFESRHGTILLKTIARGLAKYMAKQGVEKEKGEVAGWLVNALNIATETADTRSWTTLPQHIRMSRFILPPGTYDVEVTLLDAFGGRHEVFIIPGVDVSAGGTTFLNYRIY